MASYMKFELNDGTFFYIEVEEITKSSGGLIPTSRGGNAAEQPAVSFEESFGAIGKMVSTMVQKLRNNIGNEPDDVNISFGVKALSELNNIAITRGGMDSNYAISVRWRNEKKSETKEKEKKDNGEE